jgi:hypothetical protein
MEGNSPIGLVGFQHLQIGIARNIVGQIIGHSGIEFLIRLRNDRRRCVSKGLRR